jgi:GNAT superfamily N-acetyltransferase
MKPAEKNTVDDPLCRFLEWDSNFFGRNIASVSVERLDAEQHDQVRFWCEANAIDCLYFLADPDGANLSRAQDNGFYLRDVRVTLDRRIEALEIEAAPRDDAVGPYAPHDLDDLRATARSSHCDTRFYRDGNFSTELCDRLYETWIEKSCRGRADAVFVARLNGRAVGYVTCHLKASDGVANGSIGLIAVAETAHGKGLGQALIEAALRWFDESGVARVDVVTQGHNIAAQRLYQKNGFATCQVRFWFHRWFR